MGTTICVCVAAVLIVAVVCATIVALECVCDGVVEEWLAYQKEINRMCLEREEVADGRDKKEDD